MGKWPHTQTSSFHYNRCSICLLDVEQSLPDNSLLVPFHPSYAKPSNTSQNWCLTINQFEDDDGEFYSYRDAHYPLNSLDRRSILFHRRCLEFVQPLSWSQLHVLSDVIEPTLLPAHGCKSHYSRHGAFSSAELSPLQRAFQIRDFVDQLPTELRDIVLGHGVERLIFVTKAASQLSSWTGNFEPTKNRFTQKIVRLKSDSVRLLFIDLGGRVYIQDVSDPGDQMRESNQTSRDYPLGDYLAVKTDGIGVIDIAFHAIDNHPQWIFHQHSNWESHPTISIIRETRIRHLRLIRDSLKYRAILLLQNGAEPYFDPRSSPPQTSWVDSGFPMFSDLFIKNAPMTYFTPAVYVPFDTLKSFSLKIDLAEIGACDITINDPSPLPDKTTVYFSEPPTTLRFLACRCVGSNGNWLSWQYCLPQFLVDGQWQPSVFPPGGTVVSPPVVVENVLGMWYGRLINCEPINYGVVVSKKSSLNYRKI